MCLDIQNNELLLLLVCVDAQNNDSSLPRTRGKFSTSHLMEVCNRLTCSSTCPPFVPYEKTHNVMYVRTCIDGWMRHAWVMGLPVRSDGQRGSGSPRDCNKSLARDVGDGSHTNSLIQACGKLWPNSDAGFRGDRRDGNSLCRVRRSCHRTDGVNSGVWWSLW